jgi:hypothetical protein
VKKPLYSEDENEAEIQLPDQQQSPQTELYELFVLYFELEEEERMWM